MTAYVDDARFRAAMASFASGVTVITTLDESGTPFGLTATAFSSVCRQPPTCLVCVAQDAEAEPIIVRSRRFAVNFLTAPQSEVSTLFARSRADKFGPTPWEPGPVLGLPVLPSALASFECEVSSVQVAGDHTIFLGVVVGVEMRAGEPLLYYRGRYAALRDDP
jgi:flavin reductase (DIM6/NTAB) family NADH-FMN oxidoreductase RutF